MNFEFHRLRFHFEAIEPVLFPPGKAGNIIRGAFGRSFRAAVCDPSCVGSKECARRCAYREIFEPRVDTGRPSGLNDPPRPFVIRAWEFDGRRVEAGKRFWFDLHLFCVRNPQIDQYVRAFERFAEDGVGPHQAKAKLVRVEGLDLVGLPCDHVLAVDLEARPAAAVSRIEVTYATPTELKAGGESVGVPEFHVLVARLRDRISTLRDLYGDGPLDVDFRGLVERARAVRIVAADLHNRDIVRRSGNTGQTHSIGGFEGTVTYEGDLNEFMPYLAAGRWTGVGRQTTWGKGEIRVLALEQAVAAPGPERREREPLPAAVPNLSD